MAKAKPKPDCPRCNDDGLYTVLPHGNPFRMDIFSLARRLEVRICHCVAGRSLWTYQQFEANKNGMLHPPAEIVPGDTGNAWADPAMTGNLPVAGSPTNSTGDESSC